MQIYRTVGEEVCLELSYDFALVSQRWELRMEQGSGELISQI